MFCRSILDNGIRVVGEPVAGFRSVSLGVWVCAGSRDEPPDRGGISHFLEHMHFKGTARRSARDIANEIDALGGELNAFTSREGTTYYVKLLDDHLEQGLELLGDILTASRFDAEDIEREKGPVLEEISMVEDTPDDFVHDLLNMHVWPGYGLGPSILGSRESVAALRRDDLLSFVAQHYTADQIVVAAAGNFSFEGLTAILNKTLGPVVPQGAPPSRKTPRFQKGLWVHPRDLSEAHLCLAFEGLSQNHEDRYVLYVLNTILGSGVSSRLFQEIREKRGLAYSVYSYLSSYSDTGMVGVYAGTAPERAQEVVRLVVNELSRLVSERLPEADIARAREQLKGNLILGLESTSARMSQIARDEIHFGRLFTVDEIVAGINDVTVEDLTRVAGELLTRGSLSLVALGPLSPDILQPDDLLLT